MSGILIGKQGESYNDLVYVWVSIMGPGHAELYTFCKISGRTLHFSLPLSAVISPVTRGLRMQTGVRSETGFREQRKRGTF